jgi:thioredoxin reductase
MAPTTDVLIIGGGPAGLTTALTLARQVQTSIVFDDGKYRNKPSGSMHMVLTADNEDPVIFRNKARQNILDNYDTVKIEETSITSVKQIDGGFEVENDSGTKCKREHALPGKC